MVDSWSTVWLRLRTDSAKIKDDIEKGAKSADTTKAGRESGNRFTRAFSDAWAAGQKDANTKFTKSSGDAGKQAGQAAGRSFVTEFGKLIGDLNKPGAGAKGGLARGIAGGGGPNILGLNLLGKAGGITGAVGLGLGALPALAGGGLAAGVGAAGAGAVGATFGIVQSQVSPLMQQRAQAQQALASATTPAQTQAAQAKLAQVNAQVKQLSPALQSIIKSETAIQDTWEKFAKSLAPLMVGPIGQVAKLLPQLTGPLRQMFAGAATLAKPLIDGLGNLAKQVLPLLGQAFRAVAPLMGPLIKGLTGLLTGLLPGLITLLKASAPAVAVLAKFIADLGSGLGSMFAKFAPVIQASAKVFGALADVIVALLPFIAQLAAVFAQALAPVMGAFAGIIKALLPVLVIVGKVIAELAAAVITDLVAAFQAIVGLFRVISPALTVFLHAISGVFLVLENSGVFAVLAGSLEQIVKPLGALISALLRGLAPILPPVIAFIGQLSAMLAAQLGKAIVELLPPLTQLATKVLAAIAQVLPVILPLMLAFASIFTTGLVAAIGGVATALSAIITAIPPPLLKAIVVGLWGIYTAIGAVKLVTGGITLVSKAFAALKEMCILTRIQLVLLQVQTIAVKVAQVAVAVATRVWAAAQWLLNAAMTANPIGLLIVGLAALAAGIYLAWTRSATFRKILIDCWHAILVAVQAVIAWFAGPFTRFFTQTLPAVFNSVLTWVRQHWPLMLALLAGPIGLAVLAIIKHWDTIKATFKAGWDHIWSATITPMANFFLKTLPHWWDLVVAGTKLLWTREGDAFRAGWNWIWAHTVVPMQTLFTRTLPQWWGQVWADTKRLWANLGNTFRDGWNAIWSHTIGPLKNIMTVTVPGWWDTGVKAIKGFWDKLGGIVKVPVNFLIGTVYDSGIRAFWNAIVAKIPGIPNLPMINKLARGGRLPGYGGGDRNPALLESGETVVDKDSSRLPFMVAAFRAAGVPGYQHGGKVGQNPPPGGGGLFGGIAHVAGVAAHAVGSAVSGIAGDIMHFAGKVFDLGKIAAAVLSGNTTAAANAMGDMIGVPGGTTGPLAAMMLGIPKRIVKGLVGLLANAAAATGSGADIAKFAESFLGKIPYTWGARTLTAADCSGFVQAVYKHFGIDAPGTSETQGAWVKRTGPQSGGLAFYHSPPGGADPGHVAIVKNASTVISQGGGMGPTLMALHAMPLLWTGIPPGGFGGGGGGHGGVPANAAAMAGYFASHGLTRNAIAGVLGNISQESGGDPMAGSNPPGRGLIQILGDPGGSLGQELDRTMAYIAANGSVADINAHSTSAAAAATWFCNVYERPGIPALANRIAAANASYAAGYANGGWINEPVVGVGRYTKALYNFGEAGREYVTPEGQMPGSGGPGAPLIGAYHTNYYGTGDAAQAMNELTFTLRRAKQGAFYR